VLKKILVIGSGPIVIGQAAEFDYAGTQACKSLREEGYKVVLINSNPATIMTDEETADAVYIEPLTPEFCERVIARERPDGLLPTLGGQTGLNLASQLADLGILEKYGVRLLGTQLDAIRKAEDRELFRALMHEIKEPVPESWIVENEDELQAMLDVVPYPCIIRPAYTLGGTGGGVAHTREELWETGRKGLRLSMRSQLMIERSLLGWKEVEYEVMRDSKGNCITVCNMENLDPMGVHTGDSIVVAPSQTLSDIEYHMLRTASLKIIQALGIEGGCNVQLAVNPDSFDYYIIEVNPRVSRSSALASKATGYPIARVAAKIAVGRTLDEIENAVTKTTKACFEPALDYCVVKIPRWPFDKFVTGDRRLSTQMKATGEVMAIDRTFGAALLKAVRGLEVRQKDLWHTKFAGSFPTQWQGRHAPGVKGVSPLMSQEPFERKSGAYLPHWRQKGGVYFVTWRLADSLPLEMQEALKLEREIIESLEESQTTGKWDIQKKRRERVERLDRFLDKGAGRSLMHVAQTALLVEGALKHFEGDRYALLSYVVMPNHVHALVQPHGANQLEEILHSWKSFTAHKMKPLVGSDSTVWQSESYDHIVRDLDEYWTLVEYIENNPRSAGLQDWKHVSSSFQGRDALGTTGVTPVPLSDEELQEAVKTPTDERLWALAEALRRGWTVKEVNRLSRVDTWFLDKIAKLVDIEQRLVHAWESTETVAMTPMLVKEALEAGYDPESIRRLTSVPAEIARDMRRMRRTQLLISDESSREAIRETRVDWETDLNPEEAESRQAELLADDSLTHLDSEEFFKMYPIGDLRNVVAMGVIATLSCHRGKVYKMVDTCAGEFESKTPYFYSTLGIEHDVAKV